LVYAWIAGACVGYAMTIRVQAVLPFALPIAIHAFISFVRSPDSQWKRNVAMAVPCSIFVIFLLYYNTRTTGSPWLTPYDKAAPELSNFILGFASPHRWLSLDNDIMRAFSHIENLHVEMMGWPASPFIFILLLYLFRLQPKYSSLIFSCFLTSFLGLIFLNSLTNNVSPSRYIYEPTSILIVLIAIGIIQLPNMAKRLLGTHPAALRSTVALTLAVFVLCAWPYRVRDLYMMYASNFWEGIADYHHTLMDSTEKPALIFVKHYSEYRFNFFTGPPRDGNPIILAQDLGKENKKLMDFYPDRHVYYVDGWHLKKIR